jgi:signal transduction histidine kinase
MQYLFKGLFFVYMIIKLAEGKSVSYSEICIVLVFAALNIIREKYIDTIYLLIAEYLIITFGITINPYFSVFYGLLCYDLVARKKYSGIIFVAVSMGYFIKINIMADLIFVIGICSMLSFMYSENKAKGELLKTSFDKERKYNYELEITKRKLMNAAEETVHIAEIKERNRIARELHDNIGHSIAGVLMILQASNKLFGKDDLKAKELLEKSINSLSEALTLIKNTIYNMKPKDELGIDYILEIVNNFSFCKVDFRYSGNFNNLDAGYLEIISTNIKEALTNASKYSRATIVEISLIKNDNFIRLLIKDNGVGCFKINENMGLGGMKDRIKNVGGSISINGENGFTIVCIIPLKREVGGIFEDFDSR